MYEAHVPYLAAIYHGEREQLATHVSQTRAFRRTRAPRVPRPVLAQWLGARLITVGERLRGPVLVTATPDA